jgi:hypothetical protein
MPLENMVCAVEPFCLFQITNSYKGIYLKTRKDAIFDREDFDSLSNKLISKLIIAEGKKNTKSQAKLQTNNSIGLQLESTSYKWSLAIWQWRWQWQWQRG